MSSTKHTILSRPFRLLFGPSGPGKTRRARTIVVVAFALFILYSIIGFLILPPYAKRMAVSKLSDQLGRQVTIESVTLNPYTLVVGVKGFEIKENDGRATFLSFGSLHVDLQIASIYRKGPVIREIKLENPYAHLVRVNANAYNFSDIMDRSQRQPQGQAGGPFLFSVSNIQVVDGSIEFYDGPAATKHAITKINLSIPFISNLPSNVESFVEPSLSALINGKPLNMHGDTKIFADSHETSLDIVLRDIYIPYYLAYAPASLKVKVPSGLLDVVMKAAYRQYADRAPMFTLTGETRVRDLKVAVQGAKDEFLRVPLFSIKDVSFDIENHKVKISALATERGWVAVSRSADGRMNVSSLTAAPAQASGRAAKTSPPEPETVPWTVQLDSLLIDGYTVRATDQSLAEPFALTVDEINCKAHNISTEEKARGTFALSMRVGSKGKASANGAFTVNPPVANLKVNINGFPLKPVQPFLAERAQVILAAGTLNVSGNVDAIQTNTGMMSASFKGKIWVNNLSLLDKRNAEDLLKWDTLYLGGMDIRNEPLFAHIQEVSLTKFYSRVIINADRTINLQEVFTGAAPEAASTLPPKKAEAAAEVPQKPPQLPTIRIDKVTLQGGTVNFTDNSITPRFSSNLLEIGGRVSGLSSDENTMGEIELKGMYDRYAPLEITGKVNPLRNNLYVELRADFKDMDLTSVSPYSGRYAGYTIQKGKLSFHLDYLVIKNKLDAKNSVRIDQFTFGDQVESPEATKLPVRFAVALLKDRNGQINLDIPVSGELNDPKFSVGGVVLKIIENLLVKAATSPFALLSSIFGGGERLDHAEFDYGSAALNDGTKKKLDVLMKALYERPALAMDIVGHADPEKDLEGLKQALMLRKVKAQKVKELARKSEETQDLDSVIVTPEEYPEYLKRAYKAEKFPKPRNVLGMAKDLPVPEMEKLMLTNQKVTEEDLRALAGDRALAVRDYLLHSGQVDHERVFIVESKSLKGEKKEGVKDSRVDFKLK